MSHAYNYTPKRMTKIGDLNSQLAHETNLAKRAEIQAELNKLNSMTNKEYLKKNH
jgi:hypothetical protein